MKSFPPTAARLSQDETTTAHGVKRLLSIPENQWTRFDDNQRFPKDKVYKEGEQVGIARCIGVVQTSPERLLGWSFNFESDENKAQHIKSNGPNAEQYPNFIASAVNDHHHVTYSCRKFPFPLVARDFLNRVVFTQFNDDTFILAYRPIDASKETVPPFKLSTIKEGDKRIRGLVTGLYIFERLPNNCTKFTYTIKVDIKGNIPKVVEESGLGRQVDGVRRAYEYFERDAEVSH